ncbi:MAG: Mur ligase family protein, partial [Thermomicrobiales bacterium]
MVGGIEFNSNRTTPGCLFVALRGGYADGHDFLAAAVANGAAAALTESFMETDVPQIVVGDTRAALPAIAAEFFGHPSRQIDVVGVTGTDGKTTTSHLLEAILAAAGERTGMIGTMSVRIGDRLLDAETRQTTPESVDVQRHLRRMVDDGVRVAIIEATSHGLDLHRLDAIRFRAGGVTNITHEHLEHHKTIAAYRRAKAILFERVA